MSRQPASKLPREVFLSHSSKDRRVASQIAAMLREHGVPVWYSETNLIGAQQWQPEPSHWLAVRELRGKWDEPFGKPSCFSHRRRWQKL